MKLKFERSCDVETTFVCLLDKLYVNSKKQLIIQLSFQRKKLLNVV